MQSQSQNSQINHTEKYKKNHTKNGIKYLISQDNFKIKILIY